MILSTHIRNLKNYFPRNNDGKSHGITFEDNGATRYAFLLYEHGQNLEIAYWDGASPSGYLLANKNHMYYYDVDLSGRKHGDECEFIFEPWGDTLWSIWWEHGVATKVRVYGDLSKSNLLKEIPLPKELFSKKNK